jgi:hypothetical protein
MSDSDPNSDSDGSQPLKLSNNPAVVASRRLRMRKRGRDDVQLPLLHPPNLNVVSHIPGASNTAGASQDCLNRRPTVKITVRTSARVRVHPRTRFYPWMGFYHPRVRAGAGQRGLAPARTWWGCVRGPAWTRVPADAVLPMGGFLPSAGPHGRGPPWTRAHADVAWARVRADP